MKDIRIASVISASPVGRVWQNLDGMVKWIKAAKKRKTAIICFPEMNVTGYSTRDDIRQWAEPVPGPICRALQDLAAGENIIILAGLAEMDPRGAVYASHLVLKPNGYVGVYRKLHIAPPERTVFTPGKEIPLFQTREITFGIQLCYDTHFPELSTYMAQKGADLIFMPHASPRGTPSDKFRSWMRHLPARAFDNSLFVVANNQTGTNRKGLRFPGIALALDPSGAILNKNLSIKEGLMITDIKTNALTRVRNHPMRYFLPRRRSDLFGI